MSVSDLTPRQRQVCKLVGEGYDYSEVAEELGLSYRTITKYAQEAAERLPGDQRPIQKLMLHAPSLDAETTPG